MQIYKKTKMNKRSDHWTTDWLNIKPILFFKPKKHLGTFGTLDRIERDRIEQSSPMFGTLLCWTNYNTPGTKMGHACPSSTPGTDFGNWFWHRGKLVILTGSVLSCPIMSYQTLDTCHVMSRPDLPSCPLLSRLRTKRTLKD